jgi:N-acetylglucosaminyl-diphospho-decaprenol L-rhamnosyltransferase
MEPKLSIIYVNFQSSEDLVKSIRSLEKIYDFPEYEIIVVANDGQEVNINNIKTLKNSRNIGFANACNIGAREAKGEILWFLNPDTEVQSPNIASLLDEFRKEKIAVVGPKIVTSQGTVQEWSVGYFPSLTSLFFNNIGRSRDKKIWESNEKTYTDWVSGTSLFMKKSIFEKMGGFDGKFFMYFEDIDFCKRAREAGGKVIYYPEFVVSHSGGKSFKDNKLQKDYYYVSQDYYFRKHQGKMQSLLINIFRKIFLVV